MSKGEVSKCPCFAGYFRAVGEPPERECTRKCDGDASMHFILSNCKFFTCKALTIAAAFQSYL